MKSSILALLLTLSSITAIFAQNNPVNDKEAYVKMITERSAKIVTNLGITDAKKTEKVMVIIRDQYSNLNDIYAARDIRVKAIKEKNKDNKVERDSALAKDSRVVEASLAKLHKKYISKLSAQLTNEQVDLVKNGMTYNVLPITYKAYQEEILTLTDEQKKQILVWLTEAREHAMDAESSDKKHAWFGKYKGRINNYLSAAGYDLKKEGIEWEKRRKAKAQTN
ncbi:hypothetical protein SRABI27_03021 [Pedobacter sp. Bi27]|uniref:DUF3826 domain-containing protein n=1 Tax=unclassified Pedobacter TaxID=2628915 RepID=UPI001DBC5F21|nr:MULTISPECIES: DUF3826 domain-containing protein [unclassified Pedobacter]CAH0138567.1 hypothetical protein SRABI36_00485 [Pedobacter sp. Bi36]CAH0194325.1 hypothetical protein SRABI126_01579 [Pedobacter sp. Bi126]CAH0253367.1 hypothetical protein SRABI27_03021 [Pedobacter sp. Bi27]